MRSLLFLSSVAILAIGVQGCGSGKPPSPFSTTDGGDTDGSDPFADGGDPFGDSGGGDGTIGGGCNPNPDNFDIPNNNCDDDGDGTIDNGSNCDQGLQVTGDAVAFAKSIGLCKSASQGGWGIVSATYSNGFGSSTPPDAEQHGILSKFGNVIKPRQGSMLGVLSSGWAREYDNCAGGNEPFKGGCPMNGAGTAPTGYPKASPSCPNASISPNVNDVIDLKLTIKVPANAKGISFDFNFLSGEWPEYVCTTFNDSFIAYLKSNAFNNGKADNISVDSKKNPVSVNHGFFDRCSPMNLSCFNFPPNYQACAGGDAELKGTGFYDPQDSCFSGQTDSGGGGTGWLTTKAPVQPGETITLEFMIWDTGDSAYDSSVLLDNWTWETTDTSVGTVRPPN